MVKLCVVGLIAAVVMGFGAVANGAVIFEDNFSDEGKSNQNWSISNPDFITAKFENGRCIVTNTRSDAVCGYVFHELVPSKPTIFTVSTKLTRSATTGLCGLAVGFNKTTNQSILFLMLDKIVYIGKPGETLSGITSSYITDTVNKLTVSMSDTVCNVFVNDNFLTTFTYKGTPGGDIGFAASKGASVYFDDFEMSDQFTQGSKPTAFTDDFEENSLNAAWTTLSNFGTETDDNGKLKLKTANDTGAYIIMLANINLADFTGKAAFTHKSGSTANMYGLRLEGDGNKELASFVITGGRLYGAGIDSITFASSQSIGGKAYTSGTGAVTYYTDTLEIIKRAGSNQCVFFVNGDSLTSLAGINFTITKVGVFCQDSLDLTVDDFSFKPFPVAVKRPFITNRSPLKANQSAYRGLFVFDPLGRSVIANRVLGNKASSGVYFAKSQQKSQMMMIVKNQK